MGSGYGCWLCFCLCIGLLKGRVCLSFVSLWTLQPLAWLLSPYWDLSRKVLNWTDHPLSHLRLSFPSMALTNSNVLATIIFLIKKNWTSMDFHFLLGFMLFPIWVLWKSLSVFLQVACFISVTNDLSFTIFSSLGFISLGNTPVVESHLRPFLKIFRIDLIFLTP